ncbi:MAG: hypothetical protein M0R80_20100 [Proteobacteria bacterium]|nr:hypothetical protein [Pseudomonadota bacterium]
MDRMKASVCAAVVAMMMGFVWSASAQEEESTQQVDWEDAAYYAELMDTFVNDDGVLMATYYDEAQNVLWSQPASEPVEAAADVFAQGGEYAMTLDFFQWIVPTSLWLCEKDEGDDANCDDAGSFFKWSTGDFALVDTSATVAYYDALDTACSYPGIERVRATGSSNLTDYCDSNYNGYYWNPETDNFYNAYEDSCSGLGTPTIYRYTLDDSPNVDDFTYGDSERAARFRFLVPGSTYHYTEIWLASCIQ